MTGDDKTRPPQGHSYNFAITTSAQDWLASEPLPHLHPSTVLQPRHQNAHQPQQPVPPPPARPPAFPLGTPTFSPRPLNSPDLSSYSYLAYDLPMPQAPQLQPPKPRPPATDLSDYSYLAYDLPMPAGALPFMRPPARPAPVPSATDASAGGSASTVTSGSSSSGSGSHSSGTPTAPVSQTITQTSATWHLPKSASPQPFPNALTVPQAVSRAVEGALLQALSQSSGAGSSVAATARTGSGFWPGGSDLNTTRLDGSASYGSGSRSVHAPGQYQQPVNGAGGYAGLSHGGGPQPQYGTNPYGSQPDLYQPMGNFHGTSIASFASTDTKPYQAPYRSHPFPQPTPDIDSLSMRYNSRPSFDGVPQSLIAEGLPMGFPGAAHPSQHSHNPHSHPSHGHGHSQQHQQQPQQHHQPQGIPHGFGGYLGGEGGGGGFSHPTLFPGGDSSSHPIGERRSLYQFLEKADVGVGAESAGVNKPNSSLTDILHNPNPDSAFDPIAWLSGSAMSDPVFSSSNALPSSSHTHHYGSSGSSFGKVAELHAVDSIVGAGSESPATLMEDLDGTVDAEASERALDRRPSAGKGGRRKSGISTADSAKFATAPKSTGNMSKE
ncbi:hypothetical protein HK097_002196, partial [Rhizophlyctis rosea]